MNLARMKISIKNHLLLEHHFNLYYVKNWNIISLIEKDRVYKLMEKRYAELIQQDITINSPSNPSNYVWICWLQGEEQAPDLVKACINSARRNLQNHEIIVLSEQNLKEYIQFPDYIQEKWEKGIISPAHYSDLIRTELLCKYGGMWLDATVICTTDQIPKAIQDAPLFVYQELDLNRQGQNPTMSSSWYISAWNNQKILLLTRKLLHQYWKKENALNQYFLFHIFFAIAARRYQEEWKRIPVYDNQAPHILSFELGNEFATERWNEIKKMSCFHKLNHHNDYSKVENSFYKHVLNEYLDE